MPQFNATFLFVLVSFVIFMLLMKQIYFDPIMKIKHERERKLTDDQAAAQEFSQEYERLNAEYLASIKKARIEAHHVIQEIRQTAKASAQQTLVQARSSAQAETDRQMADLTAWREETYQQLSSEREALKRAVIDKVTSGRRVGSVSG